MKYCGLSDIGRSRAKNEDVWAASPEIGFFALADGIGGHKAGEVAAQETIDFLLSYARKIEQKDVVELMVELRHAIELANRHVYQMGAKRPEYHKMGTTLCCLFWTGTNVILAHVGDSRIYRFRSGRLELLTQDHSLFAEWLAKGEIAKKCTTPYPYKHVITRSIGCLCKANPDIAAATPLDGDIFFLCSDGVTDVLSIEEMEKILDARPLLEEAAESLIQAAKFKGGSDNMTVLMVQV